MNCSDVLPTLPPFHLCHVPLYRSLPFMSILFPTRYLRLHSAKYEHGRIAHPSRRMIEKKSRSDQAAPPSPFSSFSIQCTQSGSSVNQWLVTLDNRICQIRPTIRFIALLSFNRRIAKYLESCLHDPSESNGAGVMSK